MKILSNKCFSVVVFILVLVFLSIPSISFSKVDKNIQLVEYIANSTVTEKGLRVFKVVVRANKKSSWDNYVVSVDETKLQVTSVFVNGSKKTLKESKLKVSIKNNQWMIITFPGGDSLYYNIPNKWWIAEPKGNMFHKR